jgi:3-oxoacyl-[acyl-carrier protein] reductase
VGLECNLLTEEQLRAEYAAVPLGRIATPAEIAATVVFLAGPQAAFFTGQCVSPNGGAAMF